MLEQRIRLEQRDEAEQVSRGRETSRGTLRQMGGGFNNEPLIPVQSDRRHQKVKRREHVIQVHRLEYMVSMVTLPSNPWLRLRPINMITHPALLM